MGELERGATLAPMDDGAVPKPGRRPTDPADLAGRLRACFLRDLSEAERLLVILWYVERMTPDEIGQTLGMAPTRVEALHEEVLGRMSRAA